MKKKSIFILFIFLAGFYFTQILNSVGAYAVLYQFNHQNFLAQFIRLGLQTAIFILIMVYLHIFQKYFYQYVKEQKELMNKVNMDRRHDAICISIGLLIGLLMGVIVIVLRYLVGCVEVLQLQVTNIGLLIIEIASILIAVVMEELVFRKTIFIFLRDLNNSMRCSAIVTGVIFALFHIGDGIGVLDLIFYLLLSTLFCIIVERTNSISIPIGIHFGWNLLSKGFGVFHIIYKDYSIYLLLVKLISLIFVMIMIGITRLIYKKQKTQHINSEKN